MRLSASTALIVKTAAIIIVVPLAVLATYGWLYPPLHMANPWAGIIGVVVAAVLSFLSFRQVTGVVLSIVGAFLVAAVVLYLSFLLILNIFGA